MRVDHKIPMGSAAHFDRRKGIPCTSGFKNIITPLGRPTTGERRDKYMWRLIAERLLGYSMEDKFENFWTLRGKEMEHEAAGKFVEYVRNIRELELDDGVFITNDGEFIDEFGVVRPWYGGCSPDRIIRPSDVPLREGLEIKCPAPWGQIQALLTDLPNKDYKQQVQGQLLVGEFDVMHYFSYHPQMPPFHCATIRDEPFIAKLKKELVIFCSTLDEETEKARAMGIYTPGGIPPTDVVSVPGVFPWREGDALQ